MIKIRHLAFSALFALTGASNAWAERFPDVKRPIDYFVDGREMLTVNTLRAEFQEEGPMQLGRALLVIGRADLLGLSSPLDSFDTSTLETPLGGNFDVNMEQAVSFRNSRAVSRSEGRVNRVNFRHRF